MTNFEFDARCSFNNAEVYQLKNPYFYFIIDSFYWVIGYNIN